MKLSNTLQSITFPLFLFVLNLCQFDINKAFNEVNSIKCHLMNKLQFIRKLELVVAGL